MLTYQLEKNLSRARVLHFFDGLYFPIAIWLFYYLQYLDFKQIALIAAVRVISENIFEIPTGAFADIVGRKVSVVLSYFCFSVAMLGIALSHSFWLFICFEVLRGLANSLFSGSLEALVYDSLKESKKEHTYDHVVSKNISYVWFGLFVTSIVGGFLYHISPNAPYLLQSAFSLIGGFLALGLTEPRLDTMKYKFRMVITQNLAGFGELFQNKRTTFISLICIIIGAGYFVAAAILGISQAKEYGLDSRWVGLIFGFGYLLSAVLSRFYPQLKKIFTKKHLFIITALALISSFIFAKHVGVLLGSAFIILRIASSTTFQNIRSELINTFINSKNRATAISTMVLLSQLPYTILSYFIGNTIDTSSPNSFAYVLGVTVVVLLFATYSSCYIFLPFFLKRSRYENQIN